MTAPPRFEEILERTRAADAALPDGAQLRARRAARGIDAPRGFSDALRAAGRGAVIAEVKREAPSAGRFEGIDPIETARAYARAGATCVSILADPHFGMTPEEFPAVRAAAELPALWKDFVLSEKRIDLAYGLGADCVLLLARLHDAPRLAALHAYARSLGLETLHEIHEAGEIERIPADTALVGANARDLSDPGYATDPGRLARIRPDLSRFAWRGALLVAESGFSNAAQVRDAFAAGPYDAFLVGTSLLRALCTGEDLAGRISSLREAARTLS